VSGGNAPTIQDQADFIGRIRQRCTMMDGSIAGETSLRLTGDDVRALERLRDRLERMAPFEADIRRITLRGRG
jgi:hypothetical protein